MNDDVTLESDLPIVRQLGLNTNKPTIHGNSYFYETNTISALGTSQNSTPTAAQLLGGVVTQTSATADGTVTLPTGTLISAAVNATVVPVIPYVGMTFEVLFCNLGGGFNLVITGATGSTVVGNGTVPSAKNVRLVFVNTGTNTWNVYTNISA